MDATIVSDSVLDLQDLQRRIEAIERAVVEGHVSTNQVRDTMRKREISGKGNEVLTKDIVLDQILECSSYGISRRETIKPDAQMLELWEASDQDDNIDLTVSNSQKVAASNYCGRLGRKKQTNPSEEQRREACAVPIAQGSRGERDKSNLGWVAAVV